MNRLLAFYYGGHPDHWGRILAEILKQDDLWFELTHDYIQWLFPLADLSRASVNAPLLDKATIDSFIQGRRPVAQPSSRSLHEHASVLRLEGEPRRVVAYFVGCNWEGIPEPLLAMVSRTDVSTPRAAPAIAKLRPYLKLIEKDHSRKGRDSVRCNEDCTCREDCTCYEPAARGFGGQSMRSVRAPVGIAATLFSRASADAR